MKTKYTYDEANNQLIAERSLEAPKSKVWQYYTNADLLDKWWGPEPYRAVTHNLEFREGGKWQYVMKGPEGDAHYCVLNYKTIDPENSFTAFDMFANEDWSVNEGMPTQNWEVTFIEEGDRTNLKVVITVEKTEDLETLMKMGMKEGFDQGLSQLEGLLND